MDLFEYQARDLFESHQIPVLAGAVASTAEEAESAASRIGGKVVVKAQVKVEKLVALNWRKIQPIQKKKRLQF